MNKEEAAKFLEEAGIPLDTIIPMEIKAEHLLLINELIEASMAWRGGFPIPLKDDEGRLADAVDAFIEADTALGQGK